MTGTRIPDSIAVRTVRNISFTLLYHFFMNRWGKPALRGHFYQNEIESCAMRIFVNVYDTIIADSYGIPMEIDEAVISVLNDTSGELTVYLNSQMAQVGREVKKFSPGASGEELRKRIDLVRGFTPQMVAPSLRYREKLLSGGSTPAVEEQCAQFFLKKRKERAAKLSLNESVRWVEIAQRAYWASAFEQGLIPGGARVEWLASTQGFVCSECNYLHNKLTSINQNFATKRGLLVAGAPLHPGCQCRNRLVY